MNRPLRTLLAQINPTVGSIEHNAEQVREIIAMHQDTHDIIAFPELVLTGYPPEDLLRRPELNQRVQRALNMLQSMTTHCHAIIGHPHYTPAGCFNAATVLHQNTVIARYFKQQLPNYGVFDEARYFIRGETPPCILHIKGYAIGVCICEDIWQSSTVDQLIAHGANGIVCINASPFDYNKPHLREALLAQHAKRGLFIGYVNCVGGQDELVFDGQSLAYDSNGELRARAPAFTDHLLNVVWPKNTHDVPAITTQEDTVALVYRALCCGLRDYVNKNRFPGVLLGLSGGIDSALTLAIAVDALGSNRVHAVSMPSRFTRTMSIEDATAQAACLNVTLSTLPIEGLQEQYLALLNPAWNHAPADASEENLQARIRGTLLMALSNKTGNLLLTTGNKSEIAVGYTTLYGDMCGGFSVLKDVFKTAVYGLARYRNEISRVIPERVITRAPSAELAADQRDDQSLPSYAILDAILTHYIHDDWSIHDIIAQGHDANTVHRVIQLVTRSEYKRHQSAPGVKITPRAFGRDWRYPLTVDYSE